MDGKGAWRDNVFVERLWRTVKYEEVYLRAYESVADARASIGGYLGFYNPRDHIRAFTGRRQTKPISTGCRTSRRPEPGRHSTHETGNCSDKPSQLSQHKCRRII